MGENPANGLEQLVFFATTVTDEQVKAQAKSMAAKLLSYSWKYLTVDIQWYEPAAEGYEYRAGAEFAMDEWGRLTPAPNRIPFGLRAIG